MKVFRLNELTFVQHNVQAFKRPIEHDYCANGVRIELLRLIWISWSRAGRMAFGAAANELIKLNCSFDDKMRMEAKNRTIGWIERSKNAQRMMERNNCARFRQTTI